MKRKMKQKVFCLLAILSLLTLLLPTEEAQAAARTGVYKKHFVGSGAESYRTVIIKKITKKQVVFQILYDRSNPYKLAGTQKIVGKRKGNTVTFQYKDTGWGEKGKGTMKLSRNYVKIKTKTTGKIGAYPSGAWIGTDGKWFKLKRVSASKKFIFY